MTVSVITGLLLQAIAVFLVHRAIKGQWLTNPGALLLFMAVLGHGITEVIQFAFPGRNGFRKWITQAALDDFVLLVSAAILIYAITYAIVVSRRKPSTATVTPERVSGLSLRWLILLATPLIVLTWQGRGSLQPVAVGQTASRDDYASVGLAGEFMVPVVALIGAVILVRYGARWMIPVLAAEGALLSLAGTRSVIVTAAVMSLAGACMCGVRPSRRQVAWASVVLVFFVVLISATRSVAGRETFTAKQGASERFDGLIEGIEAMPRKDSRDAILNDMVYRFDSNTYGTLVLQSIRDYRQPVGLTTVGNIVLLAVPSFIDTGKLGRPIEDRNEEAFLDRQFGIPQYVDWLPSLFGVLLGYFGPLGLLVLSVLLALTVAYVEKVAMRRPTASRFVVALGATQCALLYEGGPQPMIISMRGVLFAVLLLWVLRRWEQAQNRYRMRHHPAAPNPPTYGIQPAVRQVRVP